MEIGYGVAAAVMVVVVLATAWGVQRFEDYIIDVFGQGKEEADADLKKEVDELRAANVRLALHIEELEGWAEAAKYVHSWAGFMRETEDDPDTSGRYSPPVFEQAAQIKSSIERFLDEDQLTGL